MKKPMKRVIIILLVILLIAVAVRALMFLHSPKGAEMAFRLQHSSFERAAKSTIEPQHGEDTQKPAGVDRITVQSSPYGEGYYVDFEMGASGFASESLYWGITFSRDGPVGFQGEVPRKAGQGSWYWKEPNSGDNWSRITQLAENWYLYEIHF